MNNKKTFHLELTQGEANIILLALELYEQTMLLNKGKSGKKHKELWDKIFDAGLRLRFHD